MSGIFYNGKCYLRLYNDNQLKNLSLEDNIYFTLRDIFLNISGVDYCMEANSFNGKLTNNIRYEERDDKFKYTNLTNNNIYMKQLVIWLSYIDKSDFEFEPYDDENIDEYIEFDKWWQQFIELKEMIGKRLNHLKNNKENYDLQTISI